MRYLLLTLILSTMPLMAEFNSADDTNWHYLLPVYDDQGGILDADLAVAPHTIDQKILDTLLASLPEHQKNHINHPEYFPLKEPELIIVQDAEAFVTFYSEGAGYKNTLGFYTYDGNTQRKRPTTRKELRKNGVIVYPNASAKGAGGTLKYGTTLSLGLLSEGTKVIFFLVADGWQKGTEDKEAKVLANDASTQSKEEWIFSSYAPLNKEYDPLSILSIPNDKHVAMLWDEVTKVDGKEGRILLMGFEDIDRSYGGCDHDFNDVLFSVSTSPMAALDDSSSEDKEGFAQAPDLDDQDGDGVRDDNDAYPDDDQRAYNSYYPSETGSATLAFEDMWPYEGDYDMNDVTIAFNINEIKDAKHKVKEIFMVGAVLAHGAVYQDGFAIKLNTPLSNIQEATVDGNSRLLELKADRDGNAIIYILDDVSGYIPHMGNVYKDSASITKPEIFELKIILHEAQTLMEPPYNPFLTVDNGNHDNIEVHLPNFMPTRFAADLFGEVDDDSDLDLGRSYLTQDNKPWALLIPDDFAHPRELLNITEVYFNYEQWVLSDGLEHTDWYQFHKQDAMGSDYADIENIIIMPQLSTLTQ